ncbi:MAG: hypothetical protein HFE47_04245 [Clostridia bacterium]|nr:hypothetical protein [Clostridia bacterium]
MKKKNNDNQHISQSHDFEKPVLGENERRSMIHVRGAFSESIGITNCIMQMQYNDFDERTRMQISNQLRMLLEFFFEKGSGFNKQIQYKDIHRTGGHDFCVCMLSDVFCERINLDRDYSYNWRAIFDMIHNVIMDAPYNEVLDMVWVICNWLAENYNSYTMQVQKYIYDTMNNLFENEYVGYRFVGRKIVPITDKHEIKEIETACKNPFDGCRSHIQKAVDFLADREHKDYKNCIKESICAVESICKVIVEDENADLSKAIKKLKDNGLQLHSALELAFIKLYAYTSDKGGIRHSEGMFESNVTFEEAKYMLVSCSAFVNYLVAEYGKLGGKNE